VPSDVRTHETGFASKYLCHTDKEIQRYGVRALRMAKPPLTAEEISSHDGGQTFSQLHILAESAPMRTQKLAAELVEHCVISDIHAMQVKYPESSTYQASELPVSMMQQDAERLAERRAERAERADRMERERAKRPKTAIDPTQPGPLAGGHYGICMACRVLVRLNDDYISRKHAAGKTTIRKGEEPCEGSNKLVSEIRRVTSEKIREGIMNAAKRRRLTMKSSAAASAAASDEDDDDDDDDEPDDDSEGEDDN